MAMSEKTKEKRRKLSELSAVAKHLVRAGAYDSVNDALITMYKEETGAKEFKTFWGWVHAGFSVKKGSKSFDIWAKPLNSPVAGEGTEESNEFKFFPLCCLFGSHQVEESKNKKPVVFNKKEFSNQSVIS